MKLLYFTSSYPFGIGEQWKANELEVFVRQFDEITVIPYSYDGNFDSPKKLSKGIKLTDPLFRESSFSFRKLQGIKRIILSKHRNKFLGEFLKKKVYKSRSRFVSWLYASMNVLRLLDHTVIQKIVRELDQSTILYFFWGKGSSEFLPFIDTSRCFKTIVRMHRYDLFENVNDNYIPFRRLLLENIDIAAPSSEAGTIHLQKLYPDLSDKIRLFRLGTVGNGKRCKGSEDKILRVVSCSYLSKVKRVEIMVESLQYVEFPILWRHVGDGGERQQIEELIRKYKLEEKFIIEGIIDTRNLLDFYTSNRFDVFVNVSSSEGVPMSIMESLSVSLPVIATNVGGIAELVDDEVGMILPADLTPRDLALALRQHYNLPEEEKAKKRENAYIKSRTECDAVKLSNDLAAFLKLPKN